MVAMAGAALHRAEPGELPRSEIQPVGRHLRLPLSRGQTDFCRSEMGDAVGIVTAAALSVRLEPA